MTTHIETSDNTCALSDAELADVNGGMFWLGVFVGASVGFAATVIGSQMSPTITMGDLARRHGYL